MNATKRAVWCGGLGLYMVLTGGPGAPAATAQTLVWNAGTGAWEEPANWSPERVPDGGDLAIVNNGGNAKAAKDVGVRELRIGSGVDGNFAGDVSVVGKLLAGQAVDVGRVLGAGSTGVGNLDVQGDLRGLRGVGAAFQTAPVGDLTSAEGAVTVGGNLQTSIFNFFEVGVAVNGATQADGSVSVVGAVTTGGAQFWSLGRSTGGEADGSLSARSVDTTEHALTSLNVGLAGGGGSATGMLNLGSGDLRVTGNATIGQVSTQSGGTARGTVVLGDDLVSADAASSLLRVGTGAGAGLVDNAGTGDATGNLTAGGLRDWRFVEIGTWRGVLGGDAEVTGNAAIGSGGIVYTAPDHQVGPSTLRVGVSALEEVNLAITGPGVKATGNLDVSGPVRGYDLVDIGVVQRSGDATGTVTLTDGAMNTGLLRIGQFLPYTGSGTSSGLQANTDGRLTVIDGSVSASQSVVVGSVAAPPNASDVLRGALSLQGSQLDSPFLRVGQGGTLDASGGSAISVKNAAGIQGSADAPALMTLDGSVLVAGDPAPDPDAPQGAALGVGVNAFGKLRAQAGSMIEVNGDALIGAGSFPGGDGALELDASSLVVSGSARVGGSMSSQRGRFSLNESSASIGDVLQLGSNVNQGSDFGEGMLELFDSLLDVGGALIMDVGARSFFSVNQIVRSSLNTSGGLMPGYAAINAGSAHLAGWVGVDFAGLSLAETAQSILFDLISISGPLTGSFASVDFFNVPAGYLASWAVVDWGDDGSIWRAALNQRQAVPEPGTLTLVLLALALMVRKVRRH